MALQVQVSVATLALSGSSILSPALRWKFSREGSAEKPKCSITSSHVCFHYCRRSHWVKFTQWMHFNFRLERPETFIKPSEEFPPQLSRVGGKCFWLLLERFEQLCAGRRVPQSIIIGLYHSRFKAIQHATPTMLRANSEQFCVHGEAEVEGMSECFASSAREPLA